jgi:hypothetical protein
MWQGDETDIIVVRHRTGEQEVHMKLGFVSAILPELSLEEVIDFAAAEGFDCVELMCWPVGKAERRYAGVTHVDVSEFGAGDAQRINDLLAAWATIPTRWHPTGPRRRSTSITSRR